MTPMGKPVTRIHISCFRGATQEFSLAFDPHKDLTILFGENGSGKSTILDAIDVVCNGTIGALADISVGQHAAKHLTSLGAKKGTLQATLFSDEEWWRATVNQSTVDVAGQGTRPSVRILRRKKILDLVTAQPKNRYEALKKFIDTAVVEQSEESLKAKQRELDTLRDQLEIKRAAKREQLEDLWEADGRPGPGCSPLEWAADRTSTGIEELESQLSDLKSVVSAIDTVVKDSSEHAYNRGTLDSVTKDLEVIERQIRAVPDVNAETASKLVQSLARAKAYIDAETELKTCPTCLRGIERDELIQIVDTELGRMGPLKTLVDRKASAEKNRDTAQANVTKSLDQITKSMQELHQTATATKLPEVEALAISWPDWAAKQIEFKDIKPIVTKLRTVERQLEAKRDERQRDVNQFTTIRQSYRGFVDADKELNELNAVRKGLASVHEKMRARRVTFVQDILDDIVDETNRLFKRIHPGERIGLDKLIMDEKRPGSVDQTGTFHDHSDIRPQAIFSESHLDTLGFCVWLAMAKREHPENTVLLIDDVFTSVDSQHVQRIIDLLESESASFLQVIHATHYRLWWDRCQNAQGIERIQLGRWSAMNGICTQNVPLVAQQLRDQSNLPILERQATASKAGVLLESLLDELTLLYQLSLCRNKENLHTLGELLSASKKLFTKRDLTVHVDENWNSENEREDFQPTNPSAAFECLEQLQFIRNQVGCHFSPPGTEIPDEEVRKFGSATADLIDAMTCPNCGHIASKPTVDGTALRCTCRKRAVRMTPTMIS